MEIIKLKDEFIKLGQALKAAGLVETGAEAKDVIQDLMEKKSKLKINSLKLKNFRNYDLLNLELSEQTNIFYGDNAQGKTNILESLYLCGTTKSHRGTKDKDMIQFGKDESHIEVKVEKRGIT